MRDVGAHSGDGEREEENCQHSHQSALLRSQFDHISWTLDIITALQFDILWEILITMAGVGGT